MLPFTSRVCLLDADFKLQGSIMQMHGHDPKTFARIYHQKQGDSLPFPQTISKSDVLDILPEICWP